MKQVAGLSLFALLCLSLPACAPDSGLDESEDTGEGEDALTDPRLVFSANWSESSEGKLRAGDAIEIAYDASRLASCASGEQGGVPQWSITAYYKVGSGDVHAVTVAGLNAAETPVIVPEQKGKLELWFEATNKWGCQAFDSDFGDNYEFNVAAPLGQPDWVGNGARVIDRWTCSAGPCDASRVALETAFTYGTWARQRATIAGLYFDVWEEGVTDYDNADLWKQVDAQVHLRFAGQTAFTARYVDFFQRVGNDARYELRLRTIDPFYAKPSVVPADQCPDAELSVTPDGNYVTTDVEYYFTVDGVELRPAPGQTYVGHFEDYVAPYSACMGN